MVGDYISREAALSAQNKSMNLAECRKRLERLPAADVVEVRHGRWINGRCSECGEHAPFWSMASTYHLSKYCHGCGAKMDGGQGDGN